jgi:hypothetical protein
MEHGGITPLGLPDGWPVLVDPAVLEVPQVVVGSGRRRSKLVVPGAAAADLPGARCWPGWGSRRPARRASSPRRRGEPCCSPRSEPSLHHVERAVDDARAAGGGSRRSGPSVSSSARPCTLDQAAAGASARRDSGSAPVSTRSSTHCARSAYGSGVRRRAPRRGGSRPGTAPAARARTRRRPRPEARNPAQRSVPGVVRGLGRARRARDAPRPARGGRTSPDRDKQVAARAGSAVRRPEASTPTPARRGRYEPAGGLAPVRAASTPARPARRAGHRGGRLAAVNCSLHAHVDDRHMGPVMWRRSQGGRRAGHLDRASS